MMTPMTGLLPNGLFQGVPRRFAMLVALAVQASSVALPPAMPAQAADAGGPSARGPALKGAPAKGPSAAAPTTSDSSGVSERDEVAIGRRVAVEAEQRFGGVLSDSNPLSLRVRALGARFAHLSGRKHIHYSYKVLNNETVLNAFSLPGGPIYITKRLVQFTSNDAELAYVLGHETAHIDHRHVVAQIEKQAAAAQLANLINAMLGRSQRSAIIDLTTAAGYFVWSRGYAREQESDADIAGVRWMSQLGFDPRASLTMLGKMDSWYHARHLGGFETLLSQQLSSHPTAKQREATLRRLIAEEHLLAISRGQRVPAPAGVLPAGMLPGAAAGAVASGTTDGGTATPAGTAPLTPSAGTALPGGATSSASTSSAPTSSSAAAPTPGGAAAPTAVH